MSSRLGRLETLVVERSDLVDDYRFQLEERYTVVDFVSKHAWKSLQARYFLPLSDKNCYWDLFSER
jgi:hypothetical protein